MPNNTDTYWDIDGTSLHTYAHSIETLEGLLGAPELRGEDLIIANQDGEIWTPKYLSAQTLTLSMWVRGSAQSAGAGDTGANKQLFQANWNNLVRLFLTLGRQFNLTKRFYDYQYGTGALTLYTATAKGELKSTMKPKMGGKATGKFLADVKLTDPRFYDTTLRNAGPLGATQVVNVEGNVRTSNIIISITGARNNITVRNATTGNEFTINVDALSGDTVTIDIYNDDASFLPSGGVAYDVTSKVINLVSPVWFDLAPGANTIQVTSSSGIGAVNMQYRGAWV
jgi:hypothetical protein